MDKLDKLLKTIASDGIIMSPETVQLKSMELNREFNKFKSEILKQQDIKEDEVEFEDDFSIYQSWVGHKLAVYDLTLGKILDYLNQ